MYDNEMFRIYPLAPIRKFTVLEYDTFIMLKIEHYSIDNQHHLSSDWFDFENKQDAENAIVLIKLAS